MSDIGALPCFRATPPLVVLMVDDLGDRSQRRARLLATGRRWLDSEQRRAAAFAERGGDAKIASIAFAALAAVAFAVGTFATGDGSVWTEFLSSLPLVVLMVMLSIAFISRPQVGRKSLRFWTLAGPRWVAVRRVVSVDVVPYLAIQGTTWGVQVTSRSVLPLRRETRRRICSSYSGDQRCTQRVMLDLDAALRRAGAALDR